MSEIRFRQIITELFYYYEQYHERRNITMQHMFNYYKTWGYEDYFSKFTAITLMNAIDDWAKNKVCPPTIAELYDKCLEIEKKAREDKQTIEQLSKFLFGK